MGTGFPDEPQESGNAHRPDLRGNPLGVLGEGIEQMGQAHELMKPFPRIPIIGKGVFVVISLALFPLPVDFDPPAIPRAQVTAGMAGVPLEGLTGNPGMAAAFLGNRAAFPLHFLPVFFTHHDMNREVFRVVIVEVVNVIDPPKVLVAPAPGANVTILRLPRAQTFSLFSHAGQALVG